MPNHILFLLLIPNIQDVLPLQEEEAERLEDERTAARLAAEREKKARKKERQRAKKAAEQAKKEAEDEERRKLEAIRKAEVGHASLLSGPPLASGLGQQG